MDNKNIIMYKLSDDTPVYYQNFVNIIKSLGVLENDIIMVHSEISSIGRPAGISKEILLGLWISALQECVPDGTIIMPTYNFTFASTGFFDLQNTPSTTGALTNFFLRQDGVKRTHHPMWSHAAWGRDQDYFCNISCEAFGENSIAEKMVLRHGKSLYIGLRRLQLSYEHYAEWTSRVSYRYHKEFSGSIKDGERKYPITGSHYVRYLDRCIEFDYPKLEGHLRSVGLIREEDFGASRILLIENEPAYSEIMRQLKLDETFLLIKQPMKNK
jgi:aminoglycoside 3-N-acetyltransferase